MKPPRDTKKAKGKPPKGKATGKAPGSKGKAMPPLMGRPESPGSGVVAPRDRKPRGKPVKT